MIQVQLLVKIMKHLMDMIHAASVHKYIIQMTLHIYVLRQ